MSILDRVIGAVTPPESEAARAKARQQALLATSAGDWLSMIIAHHIQIERAFLAAKLAGDERARGAAQRRLTLLLTGHSLAEEAVLYPALVRADEKGHSTTAYAEQSATKVQLSLLQDIVPMSQDYLDKLEHLRAAVAHHVYEEESKWFLELKRKLPAADQDKLSQRYQEQFARYMGDDAVELVVTENAAGQRFQQVHPSATALPSGSGN
ncbi:MAG TPA: hemerythrin domain-containing protein [Steroidobacteraceae bacterium]|jgi:hypothetical protein